MRTYRYKPPRLKEGRLRLPCRWYRRTCAWAWLDIFLGNKSDETEDTLRWANSNRDANGDDVIKVINDVKWRGGDLACYLLRWIDVR